ncbi:sporulation protein YunB [Irregularibacter muris]|uniref:sporulation protein YunB n=1 Tax=Irregularibacter muris TaxID=1796619 RepID=UPI00214BE6A1|nr:sporulation protein YunB [Irregularibacter muris]
MRNKRKFTTFFVVFISIVIIIYAFIFVDRQIRPTVEALSEVQARIIGTQAINDGISEVLATDINYNDLIDIMKDEQGNITLMQANTVAINMMSSNIVSAVQNKMKVVSNKILRIPLGNILGSQVLSSYGPKFDIEIIPAGSVIVDFYTEFEQAGINQTIHRIYLKVTTKVQIIAPLSSKAVEIISNVPIAETVIVGRVPESYINIPNDLENKDLLNIINP